MVEYKSGYNYAEVRRLVSQEIGWVVIIGPPMIKTRKYFKTKRGAIGFAKRWIADCKEKQRFFRRMLKIRH